MKMFLVLVVFFFSAVQLQAKPQVKEWTLLVYLSGNNDLDEFGYEDVNEMERVGSTDQINVVVQWASLKAQNTKRVFIKQDDDPANVTSPVVGDLGNVDMGDYHTLRDFIKWGVENYPAKRYFIDVWNHGSGWRLTKAAGITPLDISFDENTGHWITTKELAVALNEASQATSKKFDLYGSDACLMAMIEIAAEMQDAVGQFLGSQELEPGEGWPYDLLLEAWTKKPNANAVEVSQMLVNAYHQSYSQTSSRDRITLSSANLGQLQKVMEGTKVVADRLKALTRDDQLKVQSAIFATQKFYYQDYKDFVHFLNLLETLNMPSVPVQELRTLKSALSSMITNNQASAKRYPNALGLSVWLPDARLYNRYHERYRELNFSRATGWADAIRNILGL